jgi:hypothetical protein
VCVVIHQNDRQRRWFGCERNGIEKRWHQQNLHKGGLHVVEESGQNVPIRFMISRVQLDARAPPVPRCNMPFELGMADVGGMGRRRITEQWIESSWIKARAFS